VTDEEIVVESLDPASTEEEITEVVEVVGVEDRPFLTTNFEDYTVTEGLLLLVLLFGIVMACIKLLKGGFYWLW